MKKIFLILATICLGFISALAQQNQHKIVFDFVKRNQGTKEDISSRIVSGLKY